MAKFALLYLLCLPSRPRSHPFSLSFRPAQDFMKRHFQKQQEKEEKEAEKAKSGRKGEKKESESKRPSGVHATTIKPPLRRSRS
mmetsp:Transcript_30897/g.81109  ORF Transcript_30897/g.81109 Transcript_30897/m.81109 type:complete len:84 (-) Transcript_30897:1907-2158(-)